MGFIQIQTFTTGDIEALRNAEKEWAQATEGRRTLRGGGVYVDRDHPDRYMIVAEFDSYESAMENSNLPETGRIAKQLRELVDGDITYTNLDLVAPLQA
jgi:quinol monooxygenase YgiN